MTTESKKRSNWKLRIGILLLLLAAAIWLAWAEPWEKDDCHIVALVEKPLVTWMTCCLIELEADPPIEIMRCESVKTEFITTSTRVRIPRTKRVWL